VRRELAQQQLIELGEGRLLVLPDLIIALHDSDDPIPDFEMNDPANQVIVPVCVCVIVLSFEFRALFLDAPGVYFFGGRRRVCKPVSDRLADDCPRVLPPQTVDIYAEAAALNGRKRNVDRLPGPCDVRGDSALDVGAPRSYLLHIWFRVFRGLACSVWPLVFWF
jgi:hypothetical protein